MPKYRWSGSHYGLITIISLSQTQNNIIKLSLVNGLTVEVYESIIRLPHKFDSFEMRCVKVSSVSEIFWLEKNSFLRQTK